MKKKKHKTDIPHWTRRFMNMVKKVDIGMSSLTDDEPLPDIDFSAPVKSYRKAGGDGVTRRKK